LASREEQFGEGFRYGSSDSGSFTCSLEEVGGIDNIS